MADFVGAQYTIDEVNKNTDSKTAILTDNTNGLAAIKTAEGTIDGRLTNASTGLSPIKSAIDTANGYLTNGTYGLSAIKTAATNAQLCIKSIQTGTTETGYAANVPLTVNITISAVNTAKAIVITQTDNTAGGTAKLTSATNVQVTLRFSSTSVYWQVVEFY